MSNTSKRTVDPGARQATDWGGRKFREKSRDISLIYFVEISGVTTENLGEISSFYSTAAQIVFAFTPNSAAAERVFSMLKAMFGDQQMETLADIIQTALMLRINKRTVG